jgi:SPP1 family predicted phage head-tail adaptor
MAKYSTIGSLRKRLSFQHNAGTTNSMGEKVPNWTEYYSCYGSVEPMKGQLAYNTAGFISQSTFSIALRYPGKDIQIDVADHIVVDGRTFEIQAVLNKEMRNRELQILAYVVNDAE